MKFEINFTRESIKKRLATAKEIIVRRAKNVWSIIKAQVKATASKISAEVKEAWKEFKTKVLLKELKYFERKVDEISELISKRIDDVLDGEGDAVDIIDDSIIVEAVDEDDSVIATGSVNDVTL